VESAKQRLGFWLGISVTLFFVGWALLKYDFESVGTALMKANYWWVIPAAVSEFILMYIRSVRWRYFLAPIKPVSIRNSFMATSIGFLANMVLPARIGEFVRAFAIAKKEKISRGASLGTVVIERAIDGFSFAIVILVVFMTVDATIERATYWETLKTTAYMVSAFYILVFAALFLFHKRVKIVEWTIDFTLGILPAKISTIARRLLESFRSGFGFLESGHHITAIALWTVLFWAIAGWRNIAFFYAFGLYDLPYVAMFVILLAQVIGTMIPAAPGFVGPYHAATIAGLALYNIDSELGLSIAIVMHVTMFITNSLPGVVFLWLEKLSFTEIKHQAEEERT